MNFRIFFLVFLLLIPVSVVSAYNVSSLRISPGEEVDSGTPVNVTFNLVFPAEGSTTFPKDDDLTLSTNLTNPKWAYMLNLDGLDNPRNPVVGRTLSLSGFELSYPKKVAENVTIILTGDAPLVNRTTTVILLHIYEETSQVKDSYRVGKKYPFIPFKINGSDFEKTIIVRAPAPAQTPAPAISELSQKFPETIFDALKNVFGLRQFFGSDT
jgi:hypothetical protein